MIRDKSRPIGLQSPDPHRYELEDMLAFCKAHKEIYIYGAAIRQQYLYKLLKNSNKINLCGYTVTNVTDTEINGVPVYSIDEVIGRDGVGIILGLSDQWYRTIIPKFREIGFEDYFIPTEYNKQTIAERMEPRDADYNSFEISLVDHCNMSCQMCDHFSQLSEPWFVDTDVLDSDLKRMYELCDGECSVITLLGGEPLLHPELIRCLEITRSRFPDTPVVLLTNGVLLMKLEHGEKGNLWSACRENNIIISITRYPIQLDYEGLRQKALEYGVQLQISSDIHAGTELESVKISYKHTFKLSGETESIFFPTCHYFNHLGVIKDGRFYMCPVSAHSDIFNKHFGTSLELTDADYVDIYKAKDWSELAEFQSNKIPFCSYCDMKNWGCDSEWKPSTKDISEYT